MCHLGCNECRFVTVPVNMCHLISYVEESDTFATNRAEAEVDETIPYVCYIFGRSEGLCCMQSSWHLCLCYNNVENCRSKILQLSIYHHDAFDECITMY